MTALWVTATIVGSFLLGAMFVGVVGMPLAYRKGRQRTEEENRVYEGVTLAREHKPVTAEQWPVPLTERTSDLPMQFGTRSEHERRLELAGPPAAQAPPAGVEPPAPWRQARAITNLAYRKGQVLLALDRLASPLRSAHPGRHRYEDMPRLYGTVAQRRYSAAQAQRQVHLTWGTP